MLTSDQCVIHIGEETHYFIHGCLDVPIVGADQVFTWGGWCSLSQKSFEEIHEHWDDPDRTSLGPYFGWLCSEIPWYSQNTLALKTMVHQRPVGQRPYVELEPTDHPLAVHQREGMPETEAKEIALAILHADMDVPGDRTRSR